jgi:osmotically-inducible protein OsmY
MKKNKTKQDLEMGFPALGRKGLMVIAMIACFAFASAPGWSVQTERKVSDQQINNMVMKTILTDSALPNNQIDASTVQGIVTLSGTVENLMVRDRAGLLTQTLRGVRGVVNTITLQVISVPDDELAKNVRAALYYDAATDSYELKPEAKGGVVTLSGTVQSYHEKNLAVYVAREVRGVKEVKDAIIVRSKSNRPDSEIDAEVKRIIAIDIWLDGNTILTEVKNGIVTLTGAVGSYAQHGRAVLRAWTAGVKSVNADDLKVEPWARKEGQRREMGVIKSDPDIKNAVLDAFIHDPRVLSFNPTISVDQGMVTLSGTVDNLRAKRAAEQDAKNTVGVWRTRNLLTVRPVTRLEDAEISRIVKDAFLRDSIVDGDKIAVRSRLGVVTLTGAVDSQFERARADNLASRANGVVDVRNNLSVEYPRSIYYNTGHDPYWSHSSFFADNPMYYTKWVHLSDVALKQDIENELFWCPFVDRDQITVRAESGIATLTGTVYSWFESEMATEKALVGGARQVNNKLEVK